MQRKKYWVSAPAPEGGCIDYYWEGKAKDLDKMIREKHPDCTYTVSTALHGAAVTVSKDEDRVWSTYGIPVSGSFTGTEAALGEYPKREFPRREIRYVADTYVYLDEREDAKQYVEAILRDP